MRWRRKCLLKTIGGTEGTGNKELLNGQIAKLRLVMIRSCFCIIVIFISISQRRQIKKPKGNGIKDGFCVPGLCLCRSLLVFFVRSVRWAAVATFA